MPDVFAVVARPLLESLDPTSVRYVGSETPVALKRFCQHHAVSLDDRRTPGGHGDALVLDAAIGRDELTRHVRAMEDPPRLVVVSRFLLLRLLHGARRGALRGENCHRRAAPATLRS